MLEKVLSEETIGLAIEDLQKKNDSCGVDGIMISAFREYWEMNGETIRHLVLAGKYEPSAVRETELLRANGKRRIISQFTCTDRVILRAIKETLEPVWQSDFSKYSFAYQAGKGVQKAVEQAVSFLEAGLEWVLELDIDSFFDNVDIELLLHMLNEKEMDSRLLALLRQYLYCTVESDYHRSKKQKGIVQGSPVSPLLSNIYMNAFDHEMEIRYSFCRFSDDINVYFSTRGEAEEALRWIETQLKDKLHLSLNREKCGIYPAIHRKYLGYEFRRAKDTSRVFVQKASKGQMQYYRNWHTSAIQRIDRSYHLVNDGILTKKDYTVLFENGTGKQYIPVETCASLNIYSNTIFSTGFFQFMNQKKLAVSIYDKYGEYVGSFCTARHYYSTKTMLKQAAIYNDETARLLLARKIEMASLHNVRENLCYYNRYRKNAALQLCIEKISAGIAQMNEAKLLNEMLLLEARLKQEYYGCWDMIIGADDFPFEQRTRRPPKNALNALISFGNTVIYQRVATEIHKTSLDIRIGIVHSANNRNESLNLDLAELFKPILVDRAIFTAIHNKELQKNVHFEEGEDGGIYLNKEGKQIFIRRLEQKIYQKITVETEPMTYDTLMRREVQKLFKAIFYGENYKPYKYH